MTVEDLKAALMGKDYPDGVRLGDHAIVANAKKFLAMQFAECERWQRDIEKCPAYVRLVQFWEAVK